MLFSTSNWQIFKDLVTHGSGQGAGKQALSFADGKNKNWLYAISHPEVSLHSYSFRSKKTPEMFMAELLVVAILATT